MKKIIGGMVLFVLLLTGVLVFQVNEKMTQKELYGEAAVFFQEEDYKKAIQFLEEAREHQNLFSGSLKREIPYYQAEAHLKLEEYEEAIKIYDDLIDGKAKDSIAYMMKAYCLTCMEDYDQALLVYQEGYEKTKDSEFLYCLANLHLTRKEYDKAQQIIDDSKHTEEETAQKLAFLEIVLYEKQLDYKTAYEKAVVYCEQYPEDAKGIKEREFLKSR